MLVNTTISNNSATGQGFAGGFGGGAWVSAMLAPGRMALVSSTVSDNRATAGGGGLAAISISCFCGDMSDPVGCCFELPLYREGPAVTMSNTVIVNNQSPAGAGCIACESTLISQGYNLEDGDSCPLDRPGDLPNADPLLGTLTDNGGPTWTHLPLAGSPVIDAGSCPDLTADQRGSPRPVDLLYLPNAVDACDIGAVELQQ
jgi:hypothetical protein